jgi:RNA polymerase sigma-70 factor (ECF subfamily)
MSAFDIDQLVERAGRGDTSATEQLFANHRQQLRRMVSVRIDPRIAARVDPSDVVQDVLIEAARRLDQYARTREIAFYPWLRQLAWERLVQLHRHHIGRQKRSVTREEAMRISNRSAAQIVQKLLTADTNPSARMMRRETFDRASQALEKLPAGYREVLVLRHLEQLSIAEIAQILGVAEGTVKSRHYRAILQLQKQLADESWT